MHATCIDDIVNSLRNASCKIVQFSGHGTQDGILLEDHSRRTSQWLSASQMGDILVEAAPTITVALFMSCFSAQSISELIRVAPYLITVTDLANDRSTIAFVTEFYTTFLETNSVERAFSMAQLAANVGSDVSQITTVLSRRAIERNPRHVIFPVFPGNGQDSILVDLSEIERDIESLDIGKDRFLTLLSRKIRIHQWVFDTPRERALLSIGPYFGIFSWKDANDVVTCHRLLRFKADVPEDVCDALAVLIVTYNDLYVNRYRLLPFGKDNPELPRALKKAVDGYHSTFDIFFEGKYSSALQNTVPDQYRTTKAMANANLLMCDIKLYEEDYPSTVLYLESTLSAIHDLIDAFSEAVTV